MKVKILNGCIDPLIYRIPENWKLENLVGSIVNVPLKNQKAFGFVEEIINETKTTFIVKDAFDIEPFPNDITYLEFLNKISYYYQINPVAIINRLKKFILTKNKKSRISNNDNKIFIKKNNSNVVLTNEQQKIFDFLSQKINKNEFNPSLLHGVTGSGKTEIYKKIISTTIEQNKTAVFLLPEVSLALQFEQIFKCSLNENIKIYTLHSASSESEKKLLWNAILKNEPILIIGVHLPILLPLSTLGLIIVDEEHDVGYQEKKHPKINSKEIAILKASLTKIPILLGSATPSITSLYNVKNKNWAFFQLKERFAGSFAKVETIFLNDKKERKNFWISSELEKAIKNNLEKKEQTLIFLNRRGFSFFIQCKNCTFIFKCKNCSVSLTLHKNNCLYCHYCNFISQYPAHCIDCKANKKDFLKKGIGTEQVVTILEKLFPNAIIDRIDLDLSNKNKNQIFKNFKERKTDILVGTQSITKGYHFPYVTLVGILWADLNLHFPIFNATETTLQQLIQVAGRAGRQIKDSKVIVQAMMNHKIFNYLNEIDYLKFFSDESVSRENILYPPYIRLVEIEMKNNNESLLEKEINQFAKELFKNNINNLTILGPVKPIVSKIKNCHSQKIFIKSKNINEIVELYKKIEHTKYKSHIFFTPNPIT